jgi:DNA-binding CsgD family transcriptional regulator
LKIRIKLAMEEERQLIELIYEAASNPARWQDVLNRFIQVTDGIGGSLFVGDPTMDEFAFVCRYNMSEEEAAFYVEHCAATDQWAITTGTMPEGTVRASHEIWPEEEMVQSVAYQKMYGPRNWHYGMGGIFLRTPTSLSAMTMLREKEKGPCGDSELNLLRELLPHLRRAALLHVELTSLRSERAALIGQLDRYPLAFLTIAGDRRVMFANLAAKNLMAARDGLRVELGQLRATSTSDDIALRDAAAHIATNRNSQLRRLSVRRASGATPYRLLLIPIPSFGAVPLIMSQPAAAIMVIDVETAAKPEASALQELFSLTPAEIRLVSLLVQGLSLEEISTQLCVSFETVRSHLRSAFSKTATNRQGELIALVLRSVPFERL